MLDAPGPSRAANDDPEGIGDDYRLPGLAASATCALGLVIALVSLIVGHAGVAILALMVAGLAPWLGLAWVSHGRREAGTVTVRFVGH